jgi:hypothetical protein
MILRVARKKKAWDWGWPRTAEGTHAGHNHDILLLTLESILFANEKKKSKKHS